MFNAILKAVVFVLMVFVAAVGITLTIIVSHFVDLGLLQFLGLTLVTPLMPMAFGFFALAVSEAAGGNFSDAAKLAVFAGVTAAPTLFILGAS